MLEMIDIAKVVGAETHVHPTSLVLEKGTLNVLLGTTLSGKTSLMRLMAGLDKPTSGRLRFDGRDVTGIRVQERNVAMVYQQFINYPAMTVYENIASPMRLTGKDKATIDHEVRKAAELLKLTPYLDRTPLNLSGGQQQRTALARAIVKNASLVLLDEPLANLDYKLREELRLELPKIFAESGAIFVYATTEPSEALLLGGNTATLSEGRITQFGPTIEVYRNPHDLLTARIFADPPLNLIDVTKSGARFDLAGLPVAPVPAHLAGIADGPVTIAFHPHHLSLTPSGQQSAPLQAKTIISEIAGSESFVHVEFGPARWVMLARGIHDIEADRVITLHLDTGHLMAFGPDGRSISQAATGRG
jgi:glycerol transport system ATP-binding protein